MNIETGSYVRIENSDVRGVNGLAGTVISTDVTTAQVMIDGADYPFRIAIECLTEILKP